MRLPKLPRHRRTVVRPSPQTCSHPVVDVVPGPGRPVGQVTTFALRCTCRVCGADLPVDFTATNIDDLTQEITLAFRHGRRRPASTAVWDIVRPRLEAARARLLPVFQTPIDVVYLTTSPTWTEWASYTWFHKEGPETGEIELSHRIYEGSAPAAVPYWLFTGLHELAHAYQHQTGLFPTMFRAEVGRNSAAHVAHERDADARAVAWYAELFEAEFPREAAVDWILAEHEDMARETEKVLAAIAAGATPSTPAEAPCPTSDRT